MSKLNIETRFNVLKPTTTKNTLKNLMLEKSYAHLEGLRTLSIRYIIEFEFEEYK